MSTNGETKAERTKGLVDGKGNPIASAAPPADTDLIDEIDPTTAEKTTTIDPRRMSTSLLIYNFVRSTITETSLSQQLQQVAMIKKQQKHVGNVPGEDQVRQMLENCRVHRTILGHTMNERFKDFDAAYWARVSVEPYTPPMIEVEDQSQTETSDAAPSDA